MTLREYYDNLPKTKQSDFKAKWLEKTKKSKPTFYQMLKNATELDIQFFSRVTGIQATEIYKGGDVQLDIFASKQSKYRKAV